MPFQRLLPFLVCLLLVFSGCTSSLPITDSAPAVTLPPAEVNYVAPIGDAALEYSRPALLYLPDRDGIGLCAVETEVTFSLVRPEAESLTRALIAHAGNREATALGGDVRLSLYGANPVEISRDVATVNLSASALQLDREKLYLVCHAIANTLTTLDEITYVNVLVVDKPVGLDIANTLPMGVLEHNAAQDLAAMYNHLLSRRPSSANSDSDSPFSCNVVLYLPLLQSDGLVCEARNLTFENQRLPEMVTALLRELAGGPSDSAIQSPPLPLLADLLTATPAVSENTSTGGQIISLDFAHNLDDMLEAYGITRQQCTASLCYTLSSFFPNVNGVSISVNGAPVDAMMLTEEENGSGDQNVFLRSDFAELVYDYCTLYFADEGTQKLTPSRRAIPYYQCSNPRVLLCELAQGPQTGDSLPDLMPVMPAAAITDTTILGFALDGHTLLVNFAPAFQTIGSGLEASSERLFAYSLVNTLCMDDRVKNVCFFCSGTQFDGFGGDIYWAGHFFPIPQ